MKLKSSSGQSAEKPKSALYGAGGVASWAITDRKQFEAAAAQAKTGSRRAPELFLKDGESRVVRFLDEDPVVVFRAYRMRVAGKWAFFVQPPKGQPDLFASSLGLKASTAFVYRVIDIEGYTNKKGKLVTNIGRFYRTSVRGFEGIKSAAEELRDDTGASLTECNVKIKRTGTGTNTVYSYHPKSASPINAEMAKAIQDFPKWEDFYRPLSPAEQRDVIAAVSASDVPDKGNDNDD